MRAADLGNQQILKNLLSKLTVNKNVDDHMSCEKYTACRGVVEKFLSLRF